MAINDFNKAIELDPMHADAYINRGVTKYLGNLGEYCSDFKKACNLGDCGGLSWTKKNGLCK